ncbi:hypothetical protein MCERE10_03896 [Burkholderiaceae bacterium]
MSLTLLSNLAVLLLVLGTTAIVLLGWGNLTWRILGIEQPNKPSVISVWLGFCIVIGCIEIVHLFVPIDWKVTFAVGMIGLIGQLVRPKVSVHSGQESTRGDYALISLTHMFIGSVRQYPLRTFIVIAIVVTWCLRAMEVPTMYDSGLYHFGSIRWLNEYPMVPGLGNLHWRLALNQSYFGFLAILNAAPFWGKGYAAGGLFLLLLTAFTLFEVGVTQSKLWRWIFGGVLFSYLCLISGSVNNPLPDLAVSLLQIVIFLFLYILLFNENAEVGSSSRTFERGLIVLIFLCIALTTVKLSGLGFAIACISVFLFFKEKVCQRTFIRPLLIASVLIGLWVLLHVGRGYMLSGAPLFPSPVGGVWSLPWAVEVGVAHNESQLIYAWAKRPGVSLIDEVVFSDGWFMPWIRQIPKYIWVIVLSSFALNCAAFFLCATRKRHLSIDWRPSLLLAYPVVLSTVFWFVTAPDVRFLGAMAVLYLCCSAWTFLLICESMSLFPSLTALNPVPSFRYLIFSMVVFLFFRWSFFDVKAAGWEPLPKVGLAIFTTRANLVVNIPISGAQCWDAPLPCAVQSHDSLRRLAFPDWINRIWPDRLALTTR